MIQAVDHPIGVRRELARKRIPALRADCESSSEARAAEGSYRGHTCNLSRELQALARAKSFEWTIQR